MFEKLVPFVRTGVCAVIELAGVYGFTSPLSENVWVSIAMAVVMLATFIYFGWKNQNFTEAAKKAQVLLDAMKAEDVDVTKAVDEIIKKIEKKADK